MKKLNKMLMMGAMIFGLLSLNSCDKIKLLNVEETLDGGSVDFLLAPQSALIYDVAMSDKMDIEALIKPYNLSLDQVNSLKLESAVLEIMDSTAKPVTFDVIDKMSVELGTSTIALTKIASKDPVPHTALTLLNLDVQPDVDMMPFARSNDINYHLKLNLNKALDHPVVMKLSVKWKVEGKI